VRGHVPFRAMPPFFWHSPSWTGSVGVTRSRSRRAVPCCHSQRSVRIGPSDLRQPKTRSIRPLLRMRRSVRKIGFSAKSRSERLGGALASRTLAGRLTLAEPVPTPLFPIFLVIMVPRHSQAPVHTYHPYTSTSILASVVRHCLRSTPEMLSATMSRTIARLRLRGPDPPAFRNDYEERAVWEAHTPGDYLPTTRPVKVQILRRIRERVRERKQNLTLRMEPSRVQEIKAVEEERAGALPDAHEHVDRRESPPREGGVAYDPIGE
jgi:hypothetical protein